MRPSSTIIGAVLEALGSAASWFCCLPFVIGALGAGTAATWLGSARPYMNGLTVVLLGLAFFQAYRPAARCCKEDEPRRRRHRMVLWGSTVIAATFLATPYWASWVIYWSLL